MRLALVGCVCDKPLSSRAPSAPRINSALCRFALPHSLTPSLSLILLLSPQPASLGEASAAASWKLLIICPKWSKMYRFETEISLYSSLRWCRNPFLMNTCLFGLPFPLPTCFSVIHRIWNKPLSVKRAENKSSYCNNLHGDVLHFTTLGNVIFYDNFYSAANESTWTFSPWCLLGSMFTTGNETWMICVFFC